jgi:hypothetical protein
VLGNSTTKIILGKGVSLFPFHMPQPLALNTGARASFQLKALPHGHGPHGGTRPLPERRAGTESACWLEVMVLPYRGPDGTQGGLGLSMGVWTIHEKV